MTKDDAVSQGMTSIQTSIQQALGVAFDAGSNSVDQSGSGKQFAQSDIDAAVAQVTAADQSHMQALQSQITLDQNGMATLQSSMKEALAQALSIMSPGPDPTATQQVPGASISTQPMGASAQTQTGGPAPDANDGTQIPPAVSGSAAAPASSTSTPSSSASAPAAAPAPAADPTAAAAAPAQ